MVDELFRIGSFPISPFGVMLVCAFLASYLQLRWGMKRLELGETNIPNKYKELIGIGVHAETKCRYCTLFHTEAAKLFGATDAEIQEAVHFAKYTVGWSVYVNGMREDYDQFAEEVKQISAYVAEHANA